MSTVASLPIRYSIEINPNAFASLATHQDRARLESAILIELRTAREVLRDELTRAIEARTTDDGEAPA